MNYQDYNPNAPGVRNGRFMGLPFEKSDASCILLPVPWDVTTSYEEGTSSAPDNILQASAQLDVGDRINPFLWHRGIFMLDIDLDIRRRNLEVRDRAKAVIDAWESGLDVENSLKWQEAIKVVNEASRQLNQWVYQRVQDFLGQGKKVLLVGGDHSTPLGYVKALSEKHKDMGILQIDAHCDLRKAYEGFDYSHASIMYNILNEIAGVSKLVQVGIRDWCPEEMDRIDQSEGRIKTFFMQDLQHQLIGGESWKALCVRMIRELPEKVYISLDVDGLDPTYCPHTGTPVPGGLMYHQLIYLLESILDSGRKIVGADLVEVGGLPHEWDGNVGARLAYKLALLLLNED